MYIFYVQSPYFTVHRDYISSFFIELLYHVSDIFLFMSRKWGSRGEVHMLHLFFFFPQILILFVLSLNAVYILVAGFYAVIRFIYIYYRYIHMNIYETKIYVCGIIITMCLSAYFFYIR